MQDIDSTTQGPRFEDLSIEDMQRLVDAFAWLMKEDKKQNPALYQIKKTVEYD